MNGDSLTITICILSGIATFIGIYLIHKSIKTAKKLKPYRKTVENRIGNISITSLNYTGGNKPKEKTSWVHFIYWGYAGFLFWFCILNSRIYVGSLVINPAQLPRVCSYYSIILYRYVPLFMETQN